MIAPSIETADRISRYFPDINPEVQPLEKAITAVIPARPTSTATVRVAVIGAIGDHKGYRLVLDCARDAADRDLPLEFIVIGYTEDDETLIETGKAFVTGRYQEREIQDLIRREKPHLAFYPSVWPETWCFALTHGMRAGLPIVAFDLGAVAERLRSWPCARVISLTTDSQALNDLLLETAADAWNGEISCANTASSRSIPQERNEQSTGKGSSDMVGEILNQNVTGQAALTASVRPLTVPEGLYLFYVRVATPTRSPQAENLMLPALHVGLGPGITSNRAEFIPGPRANGTWLYEPGSILIARISDGPATLLLTSVQASEGPALDVEIERLDVRSPAGREASRVPPQRPPAANLIPKPTATPLSAEVTNPDTTPVISGLRLQIVTHVRNRGDLSFAGGAWAGRVEKGMWIESFSIAPLDVISASDIEYKGLTSNGFETPWVAGREACGTRGRGIPLIGFAVRLKPTGVSARYDCEYSGYFQSGVIIGPVKNGAPCRSTTPGDPLEGIQLRIVERQSAFANIDVPHEHRTTGPHFSKLREEAMIGTRAPAPSGEGRRQRAAATAGGTKSVLKKAAARPRSVTEARPARSRAAARRHLSPEPKR